MSGQGLTDRLDARHGSAVITVLAATGLPPQQLQLAGIGLLVALADDRPGVLTR